MSKPKQPSWPADKVESWPIDRLKPYERNARTHSDAQIAQIAESIKEWGWTVPVLSTKEGRIIAGHGRVEAAKRLGLAAVPVMVAEGWTDAQVRAYTLADNRLALNAAWDMELLGGELGELRELGVDLALLGFDDGELEDLLGAASVSSGVDGADDTPDVPEDPASLPGDVWILGRHRVMCGDSTNRADVARLANGEIAYLLHADPPYGMGKAADGVANDNLYRDKLDQFQMNWWRTFRPHLASNASAYIWGNAPELWRLWYAGGLGDSERFELRNEIVWDKKAIAGMASPDLTQYPMATERCLYFQFGQQFLGNINTDDFPETWEPLRSSLEAEARSAGVTPAEIRRVCGCGMYAHWFTRSQFTLIPQKHYESLGREYQGYFSRPWREIKREWDQVKGSGRNVINGKLEGMRSFFDNAHDVMRDVWDFPRVTGEGREGHATPKPVAMMERVMLSSLPEGGLCLEPFGGSGSTLIGAEVTKRTCYTMELQPEYVDVIVLRWQRLTGHKAVLEGDGRIFEEVKRERQKAGPYAASAGEGEPGKAPATAARGKSRARRADAAAVSQ